MARNPLEDHASSVHAAHGHAPGVCVSCLKPWVLAFCHRVMQGTTWTKKKNYIQSFKVGRVGDDELFGKLRINVSQCLNAQAKLGRRPLRSSVAAGTSS